MREKQERILRKVEEADLILVGIGEQFDPETSVEEVREAYRKLARLLDGKNYFVVTLCVDEYIYEAGIREDRIVRPLAPEEAETVGGETGNSPHPPMWETYMKWLQGTLHKKLLALEFGVGLQYPDIIRFPFERAVYFNQKADLVRVHDRLFQLPAQLKGRGISVSEDAVALLASMEM